MSLETGAHQCDKALVTSYKGAFKADNHGMPSRTSVKIKHNKLC